MEFTDKEIEQILFGHFQNKTHLKERRKVYLKRIIKQAKYFLPTRSGGNLVNTKPTLLLFSNELFFKLETLKDFSIYSFKDKLSVGGRLNFEHEDLLLVVASFVPFIRKGIFRYIYKRIARVLTPLKPRAFVCNYPQLLDHIIARYCRQNNVPVFTIQHGVYMPRFYAPLPFEKESADFIFVWGELYSECYQRGGIQASQLKICAPPIRPLSNPVNRSTTLHKPIFLGQGLYKIHHTVFTRYNEVLSQLIEFWNKQNVKVYYKPHPREVLGKSLTESNRGKMIMLDSDYVMDDFFSEYNVAYSINSTSLIHALCAGLSCFQFDLEIDDLPTEDFSQWTSIVKLKGVDLSHQQDMNNPQSFRLDKYFLNLHADFQEYNSRLLLNVLGHG